MMTSKLREMVMTEIKHNIKETNVFSNWERLSFLQDKLVSCGKQSSSSSITEGGVLLWLKDHLYVHANDSIFVVMLLGTSYL